MCIRDRVKVMNDSIDGLFLTGRNDRGYSCFQESVFGVKDLEGLPGVISDDENFSFFGHDENMSLCRERVEGNIGFRFVVANVEYA